MFGSADPGTIRGKIVDGKVDAKRVVTHARAVLDLTVAELGKIIDTSPRTIERRSALGCALGVAEADDLMGDSAKAAAWLKTPQRYLGGETPLAMLETEVGTQAVEQSLYAIAYCGVV